MLMIEITTHTSYIQSSVDLFRNKKHDYMIVFISSNSWQYRLFLFTVGEGSIYSFKLIAESTLVLTSVMASVYVTS